MQNFNYSEVVNWIESANMVTDYRHDHDEEICMEQLKAIQQCLRNDGWDVKMNMQNSHLILPYGHPRIYVDTDSVIDE